MEEAEKRRVAAELPKNLCALKEKADAADLPLVAYLI